MITPSALRRRGPLAQDLVVGRDRRRRGLLGGLEHVAAVVELGQHDHVGAALDAFSDRVQRQPAVAVQIADDRVQLLAADAGHGAIPAAASPALTRPARPGATQTTSSPISR